MTCLSLILHKKHVSIPRMDEKKLHTWEFQLKGIGRNMSCKLLQKRSTGKTTVFQNTCHISALKKVFFKNITDAFF